MKKSYYPKAIAGQSYAGHIKINAVQLNALFFHYPEFLFSGFIVGNKVSRAHFFSGWHLSHAIEETSHLETLRIIEQFELYLEPELGNRVAIYVSKEALAICIPPPSTEISIAL